MGRKEGRARGGGTFAGAALLSRPGELFLNFQLIEQTRTSRLAAAENLRTLQAEEETIRSLTPEFLDLKLRRQDSLAIAEFQEVQALTDYSTALSDLYRAMGVTLERNGVVVETPAPGETPDDYVGPAN